MARRLSTFSCLLAFVGALAVTWVCCHQRSAEAQDIANFWEDDASTLRHLSTTEQVLLDSAGGQYDAYAELLLTFSDGGRLPLFHQRVDLGDDDPRRAIENYRKLTDLTDRLIEQRARAHEVIGQLSERSGSSGAMDDFWSLQLLQLMPASNVAFFGVDSLIKPGWKFWAWAENARKRARADVLGIAYADPKKNKIHAGEQKMLRERIYQVAKQQFGDDPNVGGSEIEFYQNLKGGKLDHLSQRIHAEMSQDATDAGLTYMSVAATQGKRPIDKVYQEGCEGLKHGVDLYVAAGKTAVTGGLGPSAGEHFEKGWDKAKDACEKIEEAEKEYKKFKEDPTGYLQDKVTEKVQEKIEDYATKKGEELFDQARKNIKGFREGEKFVRDANDLKNEIEEAAKDPKGYLLGKVEGKLKIGARVHKFLKDKTNLSDDTTKFLSEKISENILEMGRNIVMGEMVDEELKKASGDPEKVNLNKQLRRIQDAGWDVGAVVVQRKRDGEKSGGMITVWKDPKTGRVKTTLQSVATGGDSVIPLPGDARADVLAVDERGRIDTVTKNPITVDPKRIVAVDPDVGTTKSVARDDYFEKGNSDSIVKTDTDWTPGSVGATHGLNTVDLTHLYPTGDEIDDTIQVQDYDGDVLPPAQDNRWADEDDLVDTIQDLPKDDGWQSIENDPRRQGNDGPIPRDDGGPTTLSNLSDRLRTHRASDASGWKTSRNGPKWQGDYEFPVAPSFASEEPDGGWDSLERKAEQLSKVPPDRELSDDSDVPVFPAVGTVDAVFTVPNMAAGEDRLKYSFQLWEGHVTAQVRDETPPKSYPTNVAYGAMPYKTDFEGTVEGNIFSGREDFTLGPYETWTLPAFGGPPWRQRCTFRGAHEGVTAVFRADGTATLTLPEGRMSMHVVILQGEPGGKSRDWTTESKADGMTMQGVWRLGLER